MAARVRNFAHPGARTALPCAWLIFALDAFGAAGDAVFERFEYLLPHPVETEPVVLDLDDDAALWVAGRGGDTWRYSVVTPGSAGPVLGGRLPPETIFYDACDGIEGGRHAICLVVPGGVQQLAPGSSVPTPLLDFRSLYRAPSVRGPSQIDFHRDIDGDGFGDVLLPGFDGWAVFLRRPEGFRDSVLNVAPEALVEEGRVTYTPLAPIIMDLDGDGRADISFLAGATLTTFIQTADGSFAASTSPARIEVPLVNTAKRLRLQETDQSELEIEELEQARDFNGDGLLDLLTDRTISRGVFDRRSEYHLYLGRLQEGQRVLGPAPDAIISTDGLQFEPIISDFDGDGALDVATPATELGLGRVIGALLSGKVGIDLNAFRQREDGRFPTKPDFSEETRVEFDLTTGFTRTPAIRVADFDGDGQGDLLLQTGEDELMIHRGIEGPGLFSRDAIEIQADLPNDGRMVQAQDVNGDGRADLVIRYGASDGEVHTRRLRVLLSRPESPPRARDQE